MRNDRRSFLVLSSMISALALANRSVAAAQSRSTPFPKPPEAAAPSESRDSQASPSLPRDESLRSREAAFRDHVGRLYEMTRALKDEVDQTQTSQIFSVGIYKKTGDIEKLAKQLKGLAKG